MARPKHGPALSCPAFLLPAGGDPAMMAFL